MTDIAIRMPAAVGTSSNKPAAIGSLGALLARLGEAFMAAQRRRVEREVALYIANNGGVLSDEMERRIARQFGV